MLSNNSFTLQTEHKTPTRGHVNCSNFVFNFPYAHVHMLASPELASLLSIAMIKFKVKNPFFFKSLFPLYYRVLHTRSRSKILCVRRTEFTPGRKLLETPKRDQRTRAPSADSSSRSAKVLLAHNEKQAEQ